MSTPIISPDKENQQHYTISDSTGFVAVIQETIAEFGVEGFSVVYPKNVAVIATLTHTHSDTTPSAPENVKLPGAGNASHYSVSGTAEPSGSDHTQLTINISEVMGYRSTELEQWQLTVSTSSAVVWTLNLTSANAKANWLVAAPVAQLTDVPATAYSDHPVTLTAADAKSTVTVVGPVPSGLSVNPTYAWKYSSDDGNYPFYYLDQAAPTTEPSITVTAPGVYEPVQYALWVEPSLTLADTAGRYSGELRSTSNSLTMTVSYSNKNNE